MIVNMCKVPLPFPQMNNVLFCHSALFYRAPRLFQELTSEMFYKDMASHLG